MKNRGTDRDLRTIDELKKLVKVRARGMESRFPGFKVQEWYWLEAEALFVAWSENEDLDLDKMNDRVEDQLNSLNRAITSFLRKGVDTGYFEGALSFDMYEAGICGLDQDLQERFEKRMAEYRDAVPKQSRIDFDRASAAYIAVHQAILEIIPEQDKRLKNRAERDRQARIEEASRKKAERALLKKQQTERELAARKEQLKDILNYFRSDSTDNLETETIQ